MAQKVLVAIHPITGLGVARKVEAWSDFDPALEAAGFLQGICLEGGEIEALNDLLWIYAHPPVIEDESDSEAFYTLGEPRVNLH